MADAVLTQPDPTILTGRSMFSDEVNKQLQAAMDAKGQTAVESATATATESAEAAAAAAKAKEDAAKTATTPKPKVPLQPAATQSTAKTTEEPKYPRSAIQWEEWKKKTTDEYEAKLAEARAQIKPPDTKALDQLKSERDAFEKQLRLVAIERDPAFVKEFDTATNAVLATAKSSVGLTNADTVEKILKMQPSEARDTAIEKLMDGLPTYKQASVSYALAEMDKLRNLKQAKITEAQTNWEQLHAQSLENRKQTQDAERQQMTKVLDQTIAQWSDKEKGLPVLQKRDGDESWNTQVDDSIQLAKDIFGGELDIESLARASLWAASAPLLLKDNATLMEQLKAKDAEIAQLKGLSPGADGLAGGGGAVGGTDQGGDIPAGTDYGKAIAMAVRKAGLPMQ